MKESNEYIHYSASLVNKNIYTLLDDFRNVRIYAFVWLLHSGLQLQKGNAETLLLEHARYSELTNSTREEMYTRLHINITHANRVSRYHLSEIPLIYVRGKRAKVEVREFNIRAGFRKMLVPDLSRYFMPRLSIGLFAITAAPIPDYGRSSSNRIAFAESADAITYCYATANAFCRIISSLFRCNLGAAPSYV